MPPVRRTGGILLPKKRTGAGAPRERLPLLIKRSCPSAHTGAEGIRTSIFPGIVNNRAFTIPQSQPSVRRLCQLPLHKGAGGAPPGASLRSQSVLPPWLPLWGSCHEVTERVQIALSASGTSPIGRGKFPSSARCGGHLPQRGRLWGTDCDRGILLPKNVLAREHPKAPLCKGSWQKSLIFD